MSEKTSTVAEASPVLQDSDGDLSHLYCACDDTVALCGWDLTDADELWDETSVCIVCEELDFSEGYVCPKCGE